MIKLPKPPYWVQATDEKGEFYVATSCSSWKEAVATAKSDSGETGISMVYIWQNRVDPDFGDQPDYSVDWLSAIQPPFYPSYDKPVAIKKKRERKKVDTSPTSVRGLR